MSAESFWNQALPTFLESIVFWLYLNYMGAGVRAVLLTPLFPSSSWPSVLQLFASSFLTDYLWRRFLCAGNCIDPGIPLIHRAQGKRGLPFVPVLLSCVAAAIVTYLISEAIAPVPYATWQRRRGFLFCFLLELGCDFAHEARNASWCLIEEKLLRWKRLEEKVVLLQKSSHQNEDIKNRDVKTKEAKSKEAKNKEEEKEAREGQTSESMHLFVQCRGTHSIASFITASIIAFGSFFSSGGPMLNLSYTVMAALAHRDLPLLLVLGTANLLAAHLAGLYVKVDVVKQPVDASTMRGFLSPNAPQRYEDDLIEKKLQ